MDKKLKAKWVSALRSGKYTQAKGQLRLDNGDSIGHCCLGVLCEVAGIDYDPTEGYLPDKFAERAKLDFEEQNKLTGMNDGAGGQRQRKFRGIAQYIERNL